MTNPVELIRMLETVKKNTVERIDKMIEEIMRDSYERYEGDGEEDE